MDKNNDIMSKSEYAKALKEYPTKIVMKNLRDENEETETPSSLMLTEYPDMQPNIHQQILIEVLNDNLMEAFENHDKEEIKNINEMNDLFNGLIKFSYFKK